MHRSAGAAAGSSKTPATRATSSSWRPAQPLSSAVPTMPTAARRRVVGVATSALPPSPSAPGVLIGTTAYPGRIPR